MMGPQPQQPRENGSKSEAKESSNPFITSSIPAIYHPFSPAIENHPFSLMIIQ